METLARALNVQPTIGRPQAARTAGQRLRGGGFAAVAGISVLLAFTLLLAAARPIDAHAVLDRTDPPDGTILTRAPREVRLWFTEPVMVERSTFELLDGNRQVVPIAGVRTAGADGAELILTLPDLATNTFRLNWRTISRDDLHPASGRLVFGVAAGADGASTLTSQVADAGEVMLGWIGFISLAVLVGVLAITMIVIPAGRGQSSRLAGQSAGSDPAAVVRRRLVWLAIDASVVGAIGGMMGLIAESERISPASGEGAWLPALLGTGHGLRGATIVVLFVVTGVVFGILQSRPGGRETMDSTHLPVTRPARGRIRAGVLPAIGGLLLVAIAVLRAMNGHAAGAAVGQPFVIVTATAHTLTAGLWIGGLVGLALTVLPILRRVPARAAFARSLLRRFGFLAAASVALTIASGLVLSGRVVTSLDALLFSGYGHVLLLKLALVAGVALLGLASAATLHPALGDPLRAVVGAVGGWPRNRLPDETGNPRGGRRLSRLIAAETCGALLIVVMAATMSASPPAVGRDWSPAGVATGTGQAIPGNDDAATRTMTGDAADLLVTLSISPNRPGRNFITVGVYDTRRPAPAPIERVVVQLADGSGGSIASEIVLSPTTGSGRYEASVDLSSELPPARISVVAQRPGMADVAFASTWRLGPPVAASGIRSEIVSNVPLARILDRAAALIMGGLIVLLAALGVRWGRRRRPSPGGAPGPAPISIAGPARIASAPEPVHR
jgi:copper transport protein